MPMKPSEAVTALFAPGDRPDRIAKALASAADVVIVDLEDAVAHDRKSFARETLGNILRAGATNVVVRISGIESPEHLDDLHAVSGLGVDDGLLGVLIAKVQSSDVIETVAACLRPGVEVLALVETAQGLADVQNIARARGVVRLALGGVDLTLDLDATAPGVMDFARFQLTVASRAAGIAAPLDTPSTQISDLDAVRESAERARSFGLSGKMCIHPGQLDAVGQAFAPRADEIVWAERIIAGQHAGAAQVDGAMVDRPVIERARRILDRVMLNGA
jgi:citrate lyase subunit beta/citryl-CoA lyase